MCECTQNVKSYFKTCSELEFLNFFLFVFLTHKKKKSIISQQRPKAQFDFSNQNFNRCLSSSLLLSSSLWYFFFIFSRTTLSISTILGTIIMEKGSKVVFFYTCTQYFYQFSYMLVIKQVNERYNLVNRSLLLL